MTKLLVVETSPRGDHSVSRNMTRRFLADWRAAHPHGDVVGRDLMETDLPFVTAPWLQAYFTPAEQHSPEMRDALRLSDALVAELLAAQAGLAYQIIRAQRFRAVDTMFALLIVFGVIGLCSDVALRWLRNVTSPWARP